MGAFLSVPSAAIALAVFTAMCLAALLAPWIAPQNPYDLSQVSILDNLLEPADMDDIVSLGFVCRPNVLVADVEDLITTGDEIPGGLDITGLEHVGGPVDERIDLFGVVEVGLDAVGFNA